MIQLTRYSGFFSRIFSMILIFLMVQPPIVHAEQAPRDGRSRFYWASGNKDFFGTSLETYDSMGTYSPFSSSSPISKVWFTGAEGILSEVSWPTVDRRQTRDTQFLVTDGKTFLFEERKDGISDVEWVEEGIPAFRVTVRDPKGRFSIEKTYFSSPNHDAVLMGVKFHRFSNNLKLFILHSTAAGNSGNGDHGLAVMRGSSSGLAEGFYGWQEKDAQALYISVPLKSAAVAFGGKYDGFQDLKSDFRQDYFYNEAHDGHVVYLAEISGDESQNNEAFVVSLGFASDHQSAMAVARTAAKAYESNYINYRQDWYNYRSGLANLTMYPGGNSALYYSSVAVLKSLEDKTFAGAAVAGPAVPWGSMKPDDSANYQARSEDFWNGVYDLANRVDLQTGGYQLVWIRDLYHSATALIAAGDLQTPLAMLRYIQRLQLTESAGVWKYGQRSIARQGSWAQNTWVNGEPHWKMLQMDQVAQPILLTYHLWKLRALQIEEFWPMLRDAAKFIRLNGPWTFQERWEETMGISPNTLAYEISALSGAAEIAESIGEHRLAADFKKTAAEWAQQIDAWTYTTRGTLGAGNYYLRADASSGPDAPWNPNDDEKVQITNGGQKVLERSVIDGGFMDLVRLGLKNPLSNEIQNSLREFDQNLQSRSLAPNTYVRYNYDRYAWDERTGEQLGGGAWPILTAERGLMNLAVAQARGADRWAQIASLSPFIQTMETLATPSFFLPEQRRVDGMGIGQISGAVTPLGWSHAEYIKILRKRADINP